MVTLLHRSRFNIGHASLTTRAHLSPDYRPAIMFVYVGGGCPLNRDVVTSAQLDTNHSQAGLSCIAITYTCIIINNLYI